MSEYNGWPLSMTYRDELLRSQRQKWVEWRACGRGEWALNEFSLSAQCKPPAIKCVIMQMSKAGKKALSCQPNCNRPD